MLTPIVWLFTQGGSAAEGDLYAVDSSILIAAAEKGQRMTFPQDDYTPYGYLDVPAHTRNLTPRGVLRSYGLGFRWHYPAYAGMYGGRRETYRAGFRISVDGIFDLPAFDRVTCAYHSKNIITFDFDITAGSVGGQATYHAVGEHVLWATVRVSGVQRIAVLFEYTRLIAANGEWGESGLVGRMVDGALVLQGFEDGEAFVLWASASPTDAGVTPEQSQAEAWVSTGAPGLPEAGYVTVTGARGETAMLYGVAGFAPTEHAVELLLARGKTLDQAFHHLKEARHAAAADYARKREEDDQFWSHAPRLEGDWPAHWRRSLVYDFEALRMMVKQPVGIYRHRWDAMQIQAPRVVLAEAAFDALLLAYADPGLAQELLLGTFLDAPDPNVPCSREDGSYNMVAADGTVCGTAPEWGYPWLVLEWLYALEGDHDWLERLYPALTAYLDWWLAHRRDAEGWLVYACSWESGQDGSPRFGDQPLGGGHPTRNVRPVDLQAAFAHAACVMATFARALERQIDCQKWETLASEYSDRTNQLWHAGRYADFDARTHQFTTVDDVMLLAPVALGVASPEQRAASREAIVRVAADELVWPMFVWTPVEAALAVDLPDKAAELAWAVCDRAYRFWDARSHQPERTLPGITCEYWPLHGRCGGEGYGWGAFSIHLILHALVGFTPTPERLALRPNLPLAWRAWGTHYGVRIFVRGRPLSIMLQPLSLDRVLVTVNEHVQEVNWGAQLAYTWGIL